MKSKTGRPKLVDLQGAAPLETRTRQPLPESLDAYMLADNTVTYAKIQQVSATNRILGRVTAGAGNIEELTGAQTLTILSGQAGAAFSMNSQKITTLAAPATNGDAIRATTKITEVNLEDAVDKKHSSGADTTLGTMTADIAMGGYGIKSAVFAELDETTTPGATADHGKVYTKNDNKLYFQDGAGVEHEISLAT